MRIYYYNMSRNKNSIRIGGFYMVYAGLPHPALVYEIDKKHKTIRSIKFGTTKAKHMTEIHSIQKDGNSQFVHNRPFEGVRSDYGDKELLGLTIDPQDEIVIESIKARKPMRSKRAKMRYKDK